MAKSTQKKAQPEPMDEITAATDRLIGVERADLLAAVESARARVATASEVIQRAQAALKAASLAAVRKSDAPRGAQLAAHNVLGDAVRDLTLARDSEAAAVEVLVQHDRDSRLVAESDKARAEADALAAKKRKALKLVNELDECIANVARLQFETRNALAEVWRLAPAGTADRLSGRELDSAFETLGLRAWQWRPGRYDAIKQAIVGRDVPTFGMTYEHVLS